MTYVNTTYQTGLQLLRAAASANDSGTITSADVGTKAADTATQSKSAASEPLDAYSASASISSLKLASAATSGPQAGVMAAIVAALSLRNGLYQNSVAAANAADDANSKLSSQQLSDVLLSGGSLVTGTDALGLNVQGVSLADLLNMAKTSLPAEERNDEELTQWAQSGMSSDERAYGHSTLASLTPAQILNIVAVDKQREADGISADNAIANAMANGTLKVQKATDVVGLDYTETITKMVALPNGEGGVRVTDGHYNPEFLENNKSHGGLTNIGNVGIYLSW